MKSSGSARRRLLVVEDEPAIREICQRTLHKEGFRVDTAETGKMAQIMIDRKHYDVLLIDIRMPGMSGTELFRWLQGKYPQSSNRVLFTTGSVIGKDTENFLKEIDRPCLFKPFTPVELREAVRELQGER